MSSHFTPDSAMSLHGTSLLAPTRSSSRTSATLPVAVARPITSQTTARSIVSSDILNRHITQLNRATDQLLSQMRFDADLFDAEVSRYLEEHPDIREPPVTAHDSSDDSDVSDDLDELNLQLAIRLSLASTDQTHDKEDEEEEDLCPICYDKMLPAQKTRRVCGHSFHKACDVEWRMRTRLLILGGASIIRDHCALCRRA